MSILKDNVLKLVSGFILVLFSSDVLSNDALAQQYASWKKSAPYCLNSGGKWEIVNGQPTGIPGSDYFPSKKSLSDNTCNDGDSVLFNALLCASGEEIGCKTVKRSQSTSGEWWRSPRKAGGMVQNEDRSSFSRDHLYGALLYAVVKSDQYTMIKWWDWVQENKYEPRTDGGIQTLVEEQLFISTTGGRRVCSREETKFATCPILWDTYGILHRIWGHLGISRATPMIANANRDETMLDCALYLVRGEGRDSSICSAEIGVITAALEIISDDMAQEFADKLYAKGGPTRHLYAVQILIREIIGDKTENTKRLAKALAKGDDTNVFFQYLAGANRAELKSKLSGMCPAPGVVPSILREWSWERSVAADEMDKSMLWDCIFMYNLIN